MKELSIEEKAKAYDEAIEYAHYLINERCKEGTDGSFHRADLDKMFPALKESEDERIRKALTDYFVRRKSEGDTDETWYGIPYDTIIAWLEAQGEHTNFRNKIQIGDKVTRNEDGVLVNLSQLNRVAKKDEKQGEKTKPIEGFNTEFERQVSCLIASAMNKDYEYTKDFVKWTSDALLNYAKLEIEKNSMGISEATKKKLEDNLNKALEKETPESWNKFLEKQGEQKPVDVRTTGYWHVEDVEQKPAWSEEDENRFTNLIFLVKCSKENDATKEGFIKFINKLKSLRPQNMWISVDKEVYVKEPVLAQKKDKSDPFGGFVVCCDHTLTPNVYERYMILGNIVSKNTWKPSDEQMHYLYWIANVKLGDSVVEQDVSKHLNELYQDLKKLKV